MNKKVVDQRRNHIMDKIRELGEVHVEDLSQHLHVSPLTIRRDLQYWEDFGEVERFYGGAKLIHASHNPMTNKDFIHEPCKHAIAKYAAQYIQDGDTIFINTSSTSLLVIKYIKNKRVTVITNNGKAIYIDRDPLVTVILTGGELRTPKEAMVGDLAISNLNKVSANKCFIGCSAMSMESGISTAILQEVTINETMMKQCKGEIFILADHSKIGQTHNFKSGSIKDVDYIITDKQADQMELLSFQAAGVNTIALAPIPNYE